MKANLLAISKMMKEVKMAMNGAMIENFNDIKVDDNEYGKSA
ncbi:MAG: hypothetical protein ACLTW7_15445 [Enterococcus sp.]